MDSLPKQMSVVAVVDARRQEGLHHREFFVLATGEAPNTSQGVDFSFEWLPESSVSTQHIRRFDTPTSLDPQTITEVDVLDRLPEYSVHQNLLAAFSPAWSGTKAGFMYRSKDVETWPVLDKFNIYDHEGGHLTMLTHCYNGRFEIPRTAHLVQFQSLGASGRLSIHKSGDKPWVQLPEIVRWGAQLVMPQKEKYGSTRKRNSPKIWIETPHLRYVLGSPSKEYGAYFRLLQMQVWLTQAVLNYVFFNPQSEPDFAMHDLCKKKKDKPNWYWQADHAKGSGAPNLELSFLKNNVGFVIWLLDTLVEDAGEQDPDVEVLRGLLQAPLLWQMRVLAGGKAPTTMQGGRGRTKCLDDEIAEKRCLICGAVHCDESTGEMLLCDQCDQGFHGCCLDPPVLPAQIDTLTRGAEKWYCTACKQERLQQPVQCCKIASFLRCCALEALRPPIHWDQMPKNAMAGMDDNQYGELTLHGTSKLLCLVEHTLGCTLHQGSNFVDMGSGLGQVVETLRNNCYTLKK